MACPAVPGWLVMIVSEVAVIAIFVPLVVMFYAAMIAVPITGEELVAIMPRCHPMGARIGRSCPVSFVPLVVSGYGIPVAVYPEVIRSGCNRSDSHDARGWRRSNRDAQ